MKADLKLNKLQLLVNLGWSEEERSNKQMVFMDIHVNFATAPKACKTDNLDHTFCYQQIIEHLRKELDKRSFALLEHLCLHIHQFIKQQLPLHSTLSMCITKFPPIPGLQEGVTFCYADPLS